MRFLVGQGNELRMSLIYRWRPLFVVAVALIGLCRPAAATAPTDDAALARRIAAIASIAADEYALGVVDGAVVSAAELHRRPEWWRRRDPGRRGVGSSWSHGGATPRSRPSHRVLARAGQRRRALRADRRRDVPGD